MYVSDSQILAFRPAASISAGNLSEIQTLGSHARPIESGEAQQAVLTCHAGDSVAYTDKD